MSVQLDNLKAIITKVQADITTAIALIQAQENPAQLQPLTDALTSADTALNAAVTAATPATPTA